MMYICPDCGAAVHEDDLVFHQEFSTEYGDSSWYSCPECGEDFPDLYEYEADECPVCQTGWKYKRKPVCKACAIAVESKLRELLQDFAAEELEILDIMLEGNSLDDFARGVNAHGAEAIF